MLPGAFDLEVYRGDTARWRFQLWSDVARSVAKNLSGVVVIAEARATTEDPSSVTFITTITLPNIIDMALTPFLATTLPEQSVWDLQLTYPGGDVQTILAGTVIVFNDVTRV